MSYSFWRPPTLAPGGACPPLPPLATPLDGGGGGVATDFLHSLADVSFCPSLLLIHQVVLLELSRVVRRPLCPGLLTDPSITVGSVVSWRSFYVVGSWLCATPFTSSLRFNINTLT